MGLRKLPTKPAPIEGADANDLAGSEFAAASVSTHDAEADAPTVYPEQDLDNFQPGFLGVAVATDVKTPPSLEGFETGPPASNAIAPKSSVDAFMASLEALRATLRTSAAILPPALESRATGESPAPDPLHETHAGNGRTHDRAALTSALECMPLPPAVEGPAQTPCSRYQESPAVESRKTKTPARNPEPRETPSMDNALRAVRDAVPGLNLPMALKPDTPIQGRSRPSSDGIPKSVSEDLPKYPARPRMRTCNRCGHETKLRDAKCHKCSHVDESLGVLDALIAGDLARVEQILLVKPHLITMRTSRHDWTLLHMAASGGNPKMVELLIEKGVSVDALNRDGKSALHYAAAKGHAGIVQTLLKHRADPEVLYKGQSALDLARKNARKEVVELLRHHLQID